MPPDHPGGLGLRPRVTVSRSHCPPNHPEYPSGYAPEPWHSVVPYQFVFEASISTGHTVTQSQSCLLQSILLKSQQPKTRATTKSARTRRICDTPCAGRRHEYESCPWKHDSPQQISRIELFLTKVLSRHWNCSCDIETSSLLMSILTVIQDVSLRLSCVNILCFSRNCHLALELTRTLTASPPCRPSMHRKIGQPEFCPCKFIIEEARKMKVLRTNSAQSSVIDTDHEESCHSQQKDQIQRDTNWSFRWL